ncbi:MAG: hypothetical protein ACLP0A_02765 [Verrucomicrobiia bacterium]
MIPDDLALVVDAIGFGVNATWDELPRAGSGVGRCRDMKLPPRRFPPPWIVEEHNDACFVVNHERRPALHGAALSCARSREGLAGAQSIVENCARHHIPLSRFVFER